MSIPITFASCCRSSGSNISKIGHYLIDKELGKLTGVKGRMKFKETYRCEHDANKRGWQDFLDDLIGFGHKPCVFSGIEELHKGQANLEYDLLA